MVANDTSRATWVGYPLWHGAKPVLAILGLAVLGVLVVVLWAGVVALWLHEGRS